MATKTAIGIRREMAMAQLQRVMDELFGEGFTLPTQGRDPDLLHAVQLEYIAGYLDCEAQKRQQAVEYTPPAGASVTTVSVDPALVGDLPKSARRTSKK